MGKKLFMIIAGVLLLGISISANSEIEIDSEPSTIKVFLRGAELNHRANINLVSGIHDLVFTGLPAAIDQSSIQVSAKGEAVILSVVHRTNYLKGHEKTSRVIALEDSLRSYKYALGKKKNEKEVSEVEIDLLLSNKVLSGNDKSVSVKELKNMDAFFKERLTLLKNSILDVELEIAKLEKDIRRIKNQLNEMNKMRSLPVNEIVVTVSAKTSVDLGVNLSYLIYSAGWTPKYDIRVKNIDEPSELIYNANVWQSSGVDWNDAKIILSTRDTRQGGVMPELYPWFINFMKEYGYKGGGKREMMRKTMEVSAAAPELYEAEDSDTMADYVTINQNQLAVEFTPGLKYSIPSDGKPHTVSLQEYKLPARYEYYCAPKLDSDAFLVAYLTEWSEFNLLPGKANVYFENSFVGTSYIEPYTAEDTLAVSLGRDKNIIVSRDILKDFTEDKFLSSDVERIFAYEISIRNNKSNSVAISIEDQIPIPQHEDIEVELIEKSGGKYDKNTSFIEWHLQIDPSDVVKKKLVYSVRYPKEKAISDL